MQSEYSGDLASSESCLQSVIANELETGSFFTGVFEESRVTKSKMWRCLIETIPNVNNDVIDGRLVARTNQLNTYQ